jgi:hypothetical protein
VATYANTTIVSPEKSRAEIEATLKRFGASAFGFGEDGRLVTILFRLKERHYRVNLTLPDVSRYTKAAGAQAVRSYWRALALVIKAKLTAVDAGISTIEHEFLADMIMPDRQTVGEWIRPQMVKAYELGKMPDRLMIEGPVS